MPKVIFKLDRSISKVLVSKDGELIDEVEYTGSLELDDFNELIDIYRAEHTDIKVEDVVCLGVTDLAIDEVLHYIYDELFTDLIHIHGLKPFSTIYSKKTRAIKILEIVPNNECKIKDTITLYHWDCIRQESIDNTGVDSGTIQKLENELKTINFL